MSTTIRLSRIGKKHQAQYRVVLKTTRDKRDGIYLEELGYYNPNTNPATVNLKMDRINYWIKNGSMTTETVKQLIKKYQHKSA